MGAVERRIARQIGYARSAIEQRNYAGAHVHLAKARGLARRDGYQEALREIREVSKLAKLRGLRLWTLLVVICWLVVSIAVGVMTEESWWYPLGARIFFALFGFGWIALGIWWVGLVVLRGSRAVGPESLPINANHKHGPPG
jgi:hypothetical protein